MLRGAVLGVPASLYRLASSSSVHPPRGILLEVPGGEPEAARGEGNAVGQQGASDRGPRGREGGFEGGNGGREDRRRLVGPGRRPCCGARPSGTRGGCCKTVTRGGCRRAMFLESPSSNHRPRITVLESPSSNHRPRITVLESPSSNHHLGSPSWLHPPRPYPPRCILLAVSSSPYPPRRILLAVPTLYWRAVALSDVVIHWLSALPSPGGRHGAYLPRGRCRPTDRSGSRSASSAPRPHSARMAPIPVGGRARFSFVPALPDASR